MSFDADIMTSSANLINPNFNDIFYWNFAKAWFEISLLVLYFFCSAAVV